MQPNRITPYQPLDADVLVVGAGPTGLALAAGLQARGLRALVLDRLPEGANTSRAAVVHARTLEVLEPLGVSSRLVARGVQSHRFTIRDRDRVLVDIGFSQLPTCYPYALMVSQADTEAVLLERLLQLGGQVRRPCVVQQVVQEEEGATVVLAGGERLRGRYVVGADGMHSVVREQAGIAFEGGSYGEAFVLADVRLAGAVAREEVILYFSPAGMAVVAPLPGGRYRIVATVDEAPEQPSLDFVQSLLAQRGPQQHPAIVQSVEWSSRFRVHHRVAQRYRQGRLLLAGDAAHVHSPAGGQGMNAGILDALALAEALDHALAGRPEALDRYGARRRPVAQRIVALADRLTRIATVGPRRRPLRNTVMALVARLPLWRRRLAWQLSGLAYR